jgi:putative membrane protein
LIKLIVKGIFLGGSNVIPGISAGTTALLLGIYKTLVVAFTDLFSSKEKRFQSLKILLPTGVGIALGIFLFAQVLTWLFKIPVYETLTYCFIIGLIAGSIPMIMKLHPDMKPTISRTLLLFMGLSILIVISSLNIKEAATVFTPKVHYLFLGTFQISSIGLLESFALFFLGFLASVTMILPGISGSALLVSLGQYERILNIVAERFLLQGIFFGIGIFIGALLCAKIVAYLLRKYPSGTYYFIIGLLLSSVFQIFLYSNFPQHPSPLFTFWAILLLMVGFFTSYRFSKLKKA